MLRGPPQPLALLTLFLTGLAYGQDAQLSGRIQDPSEAVIVDSEITLRSDQTGSRRTTRSSEGGLYSLTTLKPGLYRMTIRAAGFETVVREGIELQVAENARLDFTLRIGDSQTTITVFGGSPLINQEDASVGTVIDRKLIDRLPLNGRGIQTLIQLASGVTQMPVIDASRGQFVINGQRTDANYFTVDGVSANFAAGNLRNFNAASRFGVGNTTLGQAGGGMLPANNFLGTFSNLLSPSALQEFKIQTSSYAPAYGHLAGGQIDLISRSGANRFSGSVFEYFRNDKIGANDWFYNAGGTPRNPLRFDNFGGTFSGPIRLPHAYRGEGRSFFFLSIDALAARQTLVQGAILVPSLAARQSAPTDVAALLNAYPIPNTGDPNLYAGASTRRYLQRAYSLRVDHNLGENISLFARYNHAPSSRTEQINLGTSSNFEHYNIGTDTLTAGLTHVITPHLVNDLRGNFSGQSTVDSADIDDSGGAREPISSLLLPSGYSFANSTFQYTVLGSPTVFIGTYGRNRTRQFQAVDNMSWSRGSHRLMFGGDFRSFFIRRTNSKLNNLPAVLTFRDDNLALASAASGWSMTTNLDNDIEYLSPSFSTYVQDTWRLNNRLTLTWGLRWEVQPASRTTKGTALVVGGIADLNDLSKAYVLPPGRPFYSTTWNNFAPRLGVGWRLFETPRTSAVLRAGFGRFFNSAQAGFQDNARNRQVLTRYGSGPLPDLRNPQEQLRIDQSFALGAAPGYNLPSIYQWNVTLEQAIGGQTFSLGYVGSVGRRLIADIGMLRAASDLTIEVIGNNASSSYNAMQLQWNRRLSNRLQILASYTWSHSIDNLSNDISSSGIRRTLNDYYNPDTNRGSSDFDVRHSLNSAVILELPNPRIRGLSALFRNWRANTIFFTRSGLPTDILGLRNNFHRVDYVPGQPLYLYGSEYPGGKRYNPNAFAETLTGQTGTLGRNVLRGFHAWQVDFALHRQIRIAEGTSVEFRAEAFNVFNHPNFANPTNTDYLNSVVFRPTPQFGVATAMLANGLSSSLIPGELNPLFQIGGPRILQFALRLNY